MKLLLVCRGSQRDGLGHVLRTRTFAKAASVVHQVHVAAIVEPELEPLLSELPCPVRSLPSERDLPALVRTVRPDVLAYDLTRLDRQVVEACRRTPLVTASLSPVFDQMPLVDALFTRIERTRPLSGVRLFAGLQYAVFGDQCRPIDDASYERSLSAADFPLAVCMGGADAPNKTLSVVRSLVQLDCSLTIWVLLGEGYAHSYDALVGAVRGSTRHEVILAKTSRSMWHVLSAAALAVLAGGLTTVEAVYAGLPSINLCDRPEQLDMLQELVDLGVCASAGVLSEPALGTMQTLVRKFAGDRAKLRAMRVAARGKVDALGSQRVLAELERLLAARRSEGRAEGSRRSVA